MIRITEKSLLIEIPIKARTALELLADLQSGMHDILSSLDYTNAPADKITWGINQLMILLREMNISPEQAAIISNAIIERNDELIQFNRA